MTPQHLLPTLLTMDQEARSDRSRATILATALRLFSSQGYRATSVREIADAAGVSTGNLYHHFNDKEAIFTAVLNQYFAASTQSSFPLNRALQQGRFPDNLEILGSAVREIVSTWRDHIRLMYVDVIEFGGSNIARMYKQFPRAITLHEPPHLRGDLEPDRAVQIAVRVFFNHFLPSTLFGIEDKPPRSDERIIRELSGVLRDGMAPREK